MIYLRLAICDDEVMQNEKTVTVIEDYIHDRNISIDYECFESYALLKDRISEFDLFILDYEVPGINGIEFAEMLRESFGDEKSVIFLTSFDDIVYESFKVRTHRFLVKPIDREKFYEALDSYFKTSPVSRRIIIKSFGETHVINLDEVFYIEASRKNVLINRGEKKHEDEMELHKTITEMDELLSSMGFFRCHRSYLVNMKKIEKFDSKAIYFSNGDYIPVAPKKFSEFNKEYLRNAK